MEDTPQKERKGEKKQKEMNDNKTNRFFVYG